MRRHHLPIVLVLFAGLGCPPTIDTRDNPFDPEGTNPAPATLEATFTLLGASTDAGVVVELREGPGEILPLTTDDAGSVRFVEIGPGTYRLKASFAGYLAYERSVTLAPAQTLVLDPIALEPRGSALVQIIGTVEVEGASYHGGVLVRTPGAPYSTVTAADGTFSLSLPPGSYDLEFQARDHQSVTRTAVDAPADLGTILLPSLPHTVLVDVQRAVCGAEPPMAAAAEGALVEILSPEGQLVDSALVDALGAATLLGVPGGRFQARVSLAGYREQTQSFEVHDGRTLNLAPVELQAQRGGLTGIVTLENASSYAGTVISLLGTPYSTITSESGAYSLTEVCGGTYDLIATTTRVGYLPVSRAGVQIGDGAVTTLEPLLLRIQTGGFTLNAGNPYTASPTVSYDLTAPVGTSEMRLSEESDLFQNPTRADEGWVPFFQSGTFAVAATEGLHTVFAQTRTAVGVVSTVHQSMVTVDTTPPVLEQVLIDTGTGFSNDSGGNLILQLNGTDLPAPGANTSSGVAWVRVFDADLQACAGGPGACPPTAANWNGAPVEDFRVFLSHIALRPLADEEKEVWVRLGDAAGNWGTPARRNTTLDRIAPSGTSITAVGSTAGWATSNTILVQLSGTDLNPIQVRLANDSTFSGAVWRPFVDELTWFLASGDGTREVWVEFRDAAGNVSGPYSDSLTVDSVPPTAASFSVAEGAYAPTEDLNLLIGTAGSFEIRIDEDGTPGTWEPVPGGALPYTVSMPVGPGGTRTVQLVLDARDEAHNTLETPRQTSVVVDRDPPADPSVSIEEGLVVTVANVTLQVVAETGPTHADQMRLTVNGSPQGWTPFAFRQTVGLTPGTNTLGVEVRDRAGNLNSGGVQNVVVEYDTVVPALGTVLLDGGATWTDSRSVTVSVPVGPSEDLAALELRISTVADLPGAPWGAYSPTMPVTLEDREGVQTVYVEVRDAAGLVSSGQDDIRLDRIAPRTLSFTAPAFTATANPAGLSVEVLESQALGNELAGVIAVYPEAANSGTLDCSQDAASATASPQPALAAVDLATGSCATAPCTLTPSLSLPGEGRYRLQVCFRDAAGNAEVQPHERAIVFDATPPELAQAPLVVGDGRQLIASWAPLSDQGPAGEVDHYELQVDSSPSFGPSTLTLGAIPATETTATVTGLENRVRYWVRLRAVDPAGNTRDWVTDPPPDENVLVGMRAINLPLAGGHTATDPVISHVGTSVWIAIGDQRFNSGLSEATLRLNTCDLDSGQCASPSAWSEVALPTLLGGQAQPMDVAMVASGHHLWVATLEDTQLGRGVMLNHCALSDDCRNPASWTTSVLQAPSFTLGTQISMVEDRGLLRIAWADRVGFDHPGVRLCFEVDDCTQAAQWSTWMTPVPTGTMDWAISAQGEIELFTFDGTTVMLWDTPPSAGPTGVAVVGCDENDACDTAANWGLPEKVDTSVRLDSAVRTGKYIYFATDDFSGNHYLFFCHIPRVASTPATACGTSAIANQPWGSATSLSRVSLGSTIAGLHAVWWSDATAAIEYASCTYPGSGHCAQATNWRTSLLRPGVFLPRRSIAGGNGIDAVVAGKNDQGNLSVFVPIVPGPRNPTGALDEALAGISWDPSGVAAGYQFLSDPVAGLASIRWNNVVTILDPLRSRATMSVTPGSQNTVAVRARSSTGGLSDDSQFFKVKALERVGSMARVDLVAGSSFEAFRSVVGATNEPGNQTLTVRICDMTTTYECLQEADWIQVDLLTADSIDEVQLELVGDELWVGATYSFGAASSAFDLWSCDLVASGGCTQATDFLRVNIGATKVVSARLALHDTGSQTVDRVGVLYYSSASGQLRLARCDDSFVDCKSNGAGWTDQSVPLPPGIGFDDKSGAQDLVMTGSDELIAFVGGSIVGPVESLSLIRCVGAGIGFACTSNTSPFPQAVRWEPGALRIMVRQEFAPVLVGAFDHTLWAFSCNGTNQECADPLAAGRWAQVRLDSFFYSDGHALTVGFLGEDLRVLYQRDSQFTLATCRDHCDRTDQWWRAPVYFDLEAAPSPGGQEAGWIDNANRDFGLVVPAFRASSGDFADILTGGAVEAYY